MANKDLAKGIVIGLSAAVAIVLVIYLVEEYNRLKEDNELLSQRLKDQSNDKIIYLHPVPKEVRREVREAIDNPDSVQLDTYRTALKHIKALKEEIEHRDGYKILYHKDGTPYMREKEIHVLYSLTFVGSSLSVDREVNNGRGPVDFKISNGSSDSTIVEFKLASNNHLRKNLQNQMAVYGKANPNSKKVTVIFFTTAKQEIKVRRILKELGIDNKENIVLIDARKDNKPSGSKAA